MHVPEPIRAQVKIGTPATLRVDGIERTFKGQVRFIASEAEFTPYYSLTAADRSRLSFLAEVVVRRFRWHVAALGRAGGRHAGAGAAVSETAGRR